MMSEILGRLTTGGLLVERGELKQAAAGCRRSRSCCSAASTAGRWPTRGTSSASRACSRSSPAREDAVARPARRRTGRRSSSCSTCTPACWARRRRAAKGSWSSRWRPTWSGWRRGGTSSPPPASARCGRSTAARRSASARQVAAGAGRLARARPGQRRPRLLARAAGTLPLPQVVRPGGRGAAAQGRLPGGDGPAGQLGQPGGAVAAGERRIFVPRTGPAVDAGGHVSAAGQDSTGSQASPTPRPRDAWPLVRALRRLLEANAEEYWQVPELELGRPAGRRRRRGRRPVRRRLRGRDLPGQHRRPRGAGGRRRRRGRRVRPGGRGRAADRPAALPDHAGAAVARRGAPPAEGRRPRSATRCWPAG